MTLFSYLLVTAAVIMLGKTVYKYSEKKFTAIEALVWSALWVGVGVISFAPRLVSWLAGLVGIGRGVDLVIYVSILALFYLVFRLFDRVEQLSEELTSFVREKAIEDADE